MERALRAPVRALQSADAAARALSSMRRAWCKMLSRMASARSARGAAVTILNYLEHATALLGGHGFRPLVLQTLYTLSDD